MIEIRELVIRATVENSPRNNDAEDVRSANYSHENQESCNENLDIILQIIKDKKER